MPLITEDGIPHTLRAGEESITPERKIYFTGAASNAIRVALFAFLSLALVIAFRGVWGLAGIFILLAIPTFFIMRAVDKNRPWGRRGGIALFTFIGGMLILSVVISGRSVIAKPEGNLIAAILTLVLVGGAGAALCYFPHRWFAPPK